MTRPLFVDAECFKVVLADCPWKFRNFGQAKHGAARSAYPCMSDDELKRIPVERWAADEAVLLMWTTWPKLEDTFAIAAAWGFGEYVTGWPWVKLGRPDAGAEVITGIGFWVQHPSEVLLVFRVGSPTRRPNAPRCIGLLEGEPRVFYSARGKKGRRHSHKPLGLHLWTEKTLTGPYLELFGRAPRDGWTVWGNELGFELGPWGVRPCTPFVMPAVPAGAIS